MSYSQLLALTFALIQTTQAPAVDPPTPSWTKAPKGMARVVVEVTGVPGPDIPLSSEAVPLKVTFAKGRESRTVLELGRGGDWKAQSVVVEPGNYSIRFEIFGTYPNAGARTPHIQLDRGETEVVAFDLGAEDAFRFELESALCGSPSAWKVAPGSRLVEFVLPGSAPQKARYSPLFPVDGEGRGWALPALFGGALRCRLHGQSRPVERISPPTEDGRWTLRLDPTTRMIASDDGTHLTLSAFSVGRMWNGDYSSTGPYAHLATGWRRGVPLFTVFVDQQRRGIVRAADLDALAQGCTHVDQLPWVPDEPNLQVHIVNAHHALTPFGEVDGPPHTVPTKWKLLIDPVDMGYDNPDRDWDVTDRFAVVPVGKSVSNRHQLGQWDQTGGGERSATVTLPPGQYHVALEEGNGRRTYIQTAPLIIRDGATLVPLQFDIADAERRVVVARTSNGKVPGYHAARTLLLGADSLHVGERLSFMRRSQGVDAPEGEHVDVFWGWGAPPQSGRLAGAPGANGRSVPIRPVRPSDHAPFADLVVEVPNPRQLRATVHPKFGGRLSAFTDASVQTLEPEPWIRTTPPLPSKTASHDGKETLTVFLAGDSARGVLFESTREGTWAVRDWFIATQEGITFLGQENEAAARSLRITNTSLEYRQVRVRAAGLDATEYPDPIIAQIGPGATEYVWLPPTAGELSWFGIDSAITTVRPAIGRARGSQDGILLID